MLDTHQLIQEFYLHFGIADVDVYFSPGRVNLIGEHIDYNGGLVLPAAISLGISAIVHRREDDRIQIYAYDFKEKVAFSINEQFSFSTNQEVHWSTYIKATLQVLKDNGKNIHGADILIASDLPLGAGLSSSAALECLIAFIFNSK